MNIIVNAEGYSGDNAVDEQLAADVVEYTLLHMEVPVDCEVGVTVVGNDRIAELNSQYRGIDAPTDVLSFPCDDPFDEEATDPCAIGDIVVAPEVAAAQAPDFGNTFDEELTVLLVHSTLHLLGYDHIEDEDAREMEEFEREVVEAWRDRCGLEPRDTIGYERLTGEH